MSNIRTRFAPSPTGFLHIGNVYTAMLNFAFSQHHHGQFILRVEDTDRKRLVTGAEEAMIDGLKSMGIEADLGPYHQSKRLSIYQKYVLQLVKKGQAYYCFCSEKELAQHRKETQKKGLPFKYNRLCRNLKPQIAASKLKKGEKYVIRMKIPDKQTIVVNDLLRGKVKFDSQILDDQVLLKSDGYPTYHLAVVVDDHLMKISHIIRAEEWLSSTPKHVLLYRFFGWQPPIFCHTPILRNPDKSKLSKRHDHARFDWYLKQGYLPEAILNFLCLLGWSHPQQKDIFSFQEFIKLFDLKDISPVGPVVDLKKLDWFNGVWLRRKTDAEIAKLLFPWRPKNMSRVLVAKTIPLIKERLIKLSDYPDLVEFLVKEPKISRQNQSFDKLLLILTAIKNWQADELEKAVRRLVEKENYHLSKFFMAIRIALTGKKVTPPLFESMALLGKQKTLKRLSAFTHPV